ncbi:MAG: metalloprotease PmbA, partial [Pseudomonadota bacterium]|nr:metalloprotease PmbA [Pseudomonadota bacterium]
MATTSAASSPPPSVFAYSREQFRTFVDTCLASAKALGASDAVAEVSEGVGLSVSVRKGETENIERNRDKSISVTVYVGQRRGNASTSDFSAAALEQTVRAAHDIARFTAEDPAAGLPEEADLADASAARRDLDLFHPWAIDAEQAIALAARCEAAALEVDARITNSEGAGVSAQQSHFYAGNTRGFGAGYA